MSEKVFAYGSNMCSGRFRAYGVSPEAKGCAAILPAHHLVFNKRSQDGSGKANVEGHQPSHVWGVLYAIPDAHLEILDRGEGRGYNRLRMQVRINDADATEAWVYLASRPSNDTTLRPYTWYKRFLVEGAQEHFLPLDYVAMLEGIEAVTDSDEARNREKRALACRAAS